MASALMWVLGDDLPEPPPMESETPSEGGSKSSTGDEDDEEGEPPADPIVRSSWDHVITSYSIHYTKLYEKMEFLLDGLLAHSQKTV